AAPRRVPLPRRPSPGRWSAVAPPRRRRRLPRVADAAAAPRAGPSPACGRVKPPFPRARTGPGEEATTMAEAVIVSTARTPIGKAYRGAFNNTHGATLAGHVIE